MVTSPWTTLSTSPVPWDHDLVPVILPEPSVRSSEQHTLLAVPLMEALHTIWLFKSKKVNSMSQLNKSFAWINWTRNNYLLFFQNILLVVLLVSLNLDVFEDNDWVWRGDWNRDNEGYPVVTLQKIAGPETEVTSLEGIAKDHSLCQYGPVLTRLFSFYSSLSYCMGKNIFFFLN